MTTPTKPAQRPLKDMAQDFMKMIDAFSVLLTHETNALKKSDFAVVDTLQAEKKLLAADYNSMVTALAERRAEWAQMDPALRDKLVTQRDQFSILLDDNMKALERAQSSVKRLVNHILDAARAAVASEQKGAYSANGMAVMSRSATSSLATDQVL